jgi:Ni/Co efflux regulator RcnB
MKPHHRYAAVAFVFALLVSTVALAQEHTQFDEHDRKVTTDWYNQHKSNPPRGLRNQDRLSAEEEGRLQPGKPLPSDLRKKAHYLPSNLRRQLPTPPAHHKYVAVGLHVALVNADNHEVRDVIHLH